MQSCKSKKNSSVVLFQEVFGEQMPECMRMDLARVDAVFDGEFFQAEGYPAGRESFSPGV